MADNIPLPATGVTAAADDVDGVHYQRVKPAFGADGSASDVSASNGLPIAQQRLEATGTASANNVDLFSIDAGAYCWMSYQSTTTFSGTVTFQGSNDNVTWFALPLWSNTMLNYQGIAIFSGANGFGPIHFRYMRARTTSYVSGTATIVAELSAIPHSSAVSVNGNISSAAVSMTDSIGNAMGLGSGLLGAVQLQYNGTQFERVRGNLDATIHTSGARTTTQTGSDIINYNGLGVRLVLDVTIAGTGSVTVEIQGKDSVSAKYYTIFTGVAVTTVSTNVYTVYPGLVAVANVVVSDHLPRVWRTVVTANNANSMTYSLGSCILL